MATNSDRKLVYIEGSIAAGKTTLLKYIESKYSERAEVIYEPVDLWCNIAGHNLLGNFYSDPKKNGFTLQVCDFINIYLENTRLLCSKYRIHIVLLCSI